MYYKRIKGVGKGSEIFTYIYFMDNKVELDGLTLTDASKMNSYIQSRDQWSTTVSNHVSRNPMVMLRDSDDATKSIDYAGHILTTHCQGGYFRYPFSFLGSVDFKGRLHWFCKCYDDTTGEVKDDECDIVLVPNTSVSIYDGHQFTDDTDFSTQTKICNSGDSINFSFDMVDYAYKNDSPSGKAKVQNVWEQHKNPTKGEMGWSIWSCAAQAYPVWVNNFGNVYIGIVSGSGGDFGFLQVGESFVYGNNSRQRKQGSVYVSRELVVREQVESWSHVEAPYFNATSDRRAKTNITTASFNALSIINSLPIYTFNYKNNNSPSIGVIAQEAVEIDFGTDFNLVDHPDASGEDGDYMTVKESKMVYVAWKAIQEQQDLIEGLRSEIDALKKEINILKG